MSLRLTQADDDEGYYHRTEACSIIAIGVTIEQDRSFGIGEASDEEENREKDGHIVDERRDGKNGFKR